MEKEIMPFMIQLTKNDYEILDEALDLLIENHKLRYQYNINFSEKPKDLIEISNLREYLNNCSKNAKR
jgi:hypothetical protein